MWTLSTEDYRIDQITALQLDILLEQGFRHFGSHFFRYAAVSSSEGIKRILPLRVRVGAFKPSRRHARTLAAGATFDTIIQPAFVNGDVEKLFEQHKGKFSSNVPDNIYSFVSQEPATVPCDCVCICIYDQGRLIGISYLDVSERGGSSVYQCYDLGYGRYALGILMILKCLEFCQNQGKIFYYLGYATQESSAYDYKKQFKATEFYDWQGNWQTLDEKS